MATRTAHPAEAHIGSGRRDGSHDADSSCGCPACFAVAMARETVHEVVREPHLSAGYLLRERL